MYEAGEYHRAAELYAQLAEKAEHRKIPQAPNLYLRSGEAWLKTGNLKNAENFIKRGLGLFAARQKWMQLKKASSFTLERLKAENQPELAEKISAWLETQIPAGIKQSDLWLKADKTTASMKQVKLPSNCGNCGGPVKPKEVDWYDAANPVCPYCGSILSSDG